MENASKALIMAAGILIGVLILSLAVFLFADFGATSAKMHSQIEEQQLVKFNTQFTKYAGRSDLTIYNIVTVANLAKENNEYYKEYSTYIDEYKITIKLGNTQIQGYSISQMQQLLSDNSDINQETASLNKIYKCKSDKYHSNGRISEISFEKIYN